MTYKPWRWRNCRDIGFSFGFWPLNWTWPMGMRSGDQYGITHRIQIGPFDFSLEANDGSWRNSELFEYEVYGNNAKVCSNCGTSMHYGTGPSGHGKPRWECLKCGVIE